MNLHFKTSTMKQLITFIFLPLLFIACTSNRQVRNDEASDYSHTIKEQAETMKNFLLKKDFKSFTSFTYPKVVQMIGGEAKMVEMLENGMRNTEAQGTVFLDVIMGEPSNVIKQGSELQCTIPQTLKMKVPDGKLTQKSTLIGISMDHGNRWYFVDVSGKDLAEMQRALPNLSSELIIPEKEEPVLEKE
jgi:hypothetical protein